MHCYNTIWNAGHIVTVLRCLARDGGPVCVVSILNHFTQAYCYIINLSCHIVMVLKCLARDGGSVCVVSISNHLTQMYCYKTFFVPVTLFITHIVTVPCQRWRANMRLFYEFWIIWHIYVHCYIINIFWNIWYICPSCINVSRVVDCCWHVDCTYCFGVMVPDDQYVLSIHPCLPSFIHTNQLWLISCLWKMNGQGFEQMLSWNNRNDIALFVNPNWQKLGNK